MKLEIELRCILFPLIILEMFLQMDWHTSVYIRSHSWQCMSEQKPSHEVEGIVRRAPRKDCVEAQVWGRLPKHFYRIEGPQEHSGLHHSYMEEVWNHQDSSLNWPTGPTEQSGEKNLDQGGDQGPNGHFDRAPEFICGD